MRKQYEDVELLVMEIQDVITTSGDRGVEDDDGEKFNEI